MLCNRAASLYSPRDQPHTEQVVESEVNSKGDRLSCLTFLLIPIDPAEEFFNLSAAGSGKTDGPRQIRPRGILCTFSHIFRGPSVHVINILLILGLGKEKGTN